MSLRVGWKHLTAIRDQIFANAIVLFAPQVHSKDVLEIIIEYDANITDTDAKARARLIFRGFVDGIDKTLALTERRDMVEYAMVDLLEALASELNTKQEEGTGNVAEIEDGVKSANGVVFERRSLN